MKAWHIKAFGSSDALRFEDIEPPAIQANDVLVKVKAAAVNPADLKVLAGAKAGRFLHDRSLPLFPGFDFSGTVEKTGPGLSSPVEGDRVFGFLPYSAKTKQGTFSEFVAVKADQLAPKPAKISHSQAACAATVSVTALQALRDKGGIQTGCRVLVNGASGGVGSAAVQIAKIYQARVWGTSSAANLESVQTMGADRAIDYQKTSVAELNETFDIVFDVASVSSFSACAAILSHRGVYVTLLPSPAFFSGKLKSLFSGKSCDMVMVKVKTEDLKQIGQWMEQKRLTIPIEAEYPMSALPDAIRHLEKGGVKGKIAVTNATT